MLLRQWAGLALVVLGLLRAAILVAHDPLAGYAESPDMLRTAACLGLSPASPTPDPAGPVARYTAGKPVKEKCDPGSEVVIGAAVIAAAQVAGVDTSGIRLQWIGWAKLAILAATALAFAWYFHHHPAASIAHGLVVLLVMADPAVTLWFNTLAAEFSLLWGLYAMIVAACAVVISERNSLLAWLVLLDALAALAFARQELALLAPLLALGALPWLWPRSQHLAVVAFGVALVTGLVSYDLVPRPAEARVGAANARIGVKEARAFADSAARLLPATQSLAPRLGALEGTKRVEAADLPWWGRSTLAAVAARIPSRTFAMLSLAIYCLVPLVALVAIAVAQPSRTDHGAALLAAILLGGTAMYALAVTVVHGDAAGAARHYLPGALATLTALLGLVVALPSLLWRWWQAPKKGALEMVMALGAVGIVGCVEFLTLGWAETRPLAIGAVDKPPATPAVRSGVQVGGWALDPFGVEEVRVRLGAFEGAAKHGAGADTGDEPRFPGYPDAGGARFALDLGAEDIAKAGAQTKLPLRITVKSRAGPSTEIVSRELELAP